MDKYLAGDKDAVNKLQRLMEAAHAEGGMRFACVFSGGWWGRPWVGLFRSIQTHLNLAHRSKKYVLGLPTVEGPTGPTTRKRLRAIKDNPVPIF